jgi:hypothetical protein
LKDCDNQGPGKESDRDGVGDGSYFRSWIWLPNPQVLDTADGEAGEEGASEEDVNEILRVEWTTSFARLERWSEEVDLLQEETVVTGGRGGLTWQAHCEFVESF